MESKTTIKRTIYSDEQSALAKLTNNGVVKEVIGTRINLDKNRAIGIKLWGAVDYLINHGRYESWYKV